MADVGKPGMRPSRLAVLAACLTSGFVSLPPSPSCSVSRALGRQTEDEGHPSSPDAVFHVLYDHVRHRASEYLDQETLEETLGDLPAFSRYSPEARDSVADAWTELGQDMREAAEEISHEHSVPSR